MLHTLVHSLHARCRWDVRRGQWFLQSPDLVRTLRSRLGSACVRARPSRPPRSASTTLAKGQRAPQALRVPNPPRAKHEGTHPQKSEPRWQGNATPGSCKKYTRLSKPARRLLAHTPLPVPACACLCLPVQHGPWRAHARAYCRAVCDRCHGMMIGKCRGGPTQARGGGDTHTHAKDCKAGIDIEAANNAGGYSVPANSPQVGRAHSFASPQRSRLDTNHPHTRGGGGGRRAVRIAHRPQSFKSDAREPSRRSHEPRVERERGEREKDKRGRKHTKTNEERKVKLVSFYYKV